MALGKKGKIGDLGTPVTIETYEEDKDEMGQPIKDWKYYCKAWAKPKALRGEDFWSAQQAQSDITGELELRYDPGLMDKLREDIEKVRLKADERTMHIKSFYDPDERKRRIHLMIKESL